MPAFLITPAMKLGAIAAAVVLLFGFGFRTGYHMADQAWNASIAQQAQRAIATVQKSAEITERVVTKFIKVQGDTETVIRTIEKEIPVYVKDPVTVAADCPPAVPAGLARVLNDAIRLSPAADPPGPADDASSGLTDADLARWAVQVIGQYQALAQQLEALQAWNQEQYELRMSP